MPSEVNVGRIERILNRHIGSEEIPFLKRLNDAWIEIHRIGENSRLYEKRNIDPVIESLEGIEKGLREEPQFIQNVEKATENLVKITEDDRSKILEFHAIEDEKKIFKEVKRSARKLQQAINILKSIILNPQRTPGITQITRRDNIERGLDLAFNICQTVYRNIRKVIFLERHTEAYLRQLR